MSVHDPRATLRQIRDAAHRLQTICADKTLEQLLATLLVTVEQMLKALDSGERA
jgi:hypothetical protein